MIYLAFIDASGQNGAIGALGKTTTKAMTISDFYCRVFYGALGAPADPWMPYGFELLPSIAKLISWEINSSLARSHQSLHYLSLLFNERSDGKSINLLWMVHGSWFMVHAWPSNGPAWDPQAGPPFLVMRHELWIMNHSPSIVRWIKNQMFDLWRNDK